MGKLNDELERMLEAYKESGNLVFYGPHNTFAGIKQQEIRRICAKLGLTLAADQLLASEAYDKFISDFLPIAPPGRGAWGLSKLNRELWESKVCEYICVEKAKIINPDWVPGIQERFKHEQEHLIAEIVAHKLTHSPEPQPYKLTDFEKENQDEELPRIFRQTGTIIHKA